jgi:GNAT superfamily N-acetyltransferase
VDELAAAIELDRRMTVRAADEVIELPWGLAVRNPRLPRVYHLNTLLLSATLPPQLGAVQLAELAEEQQGDLDHRRVLLNDAEAGERLSAKLEPLGWERDRTQWMALRCDPAAALVDPRARLLSEEELQHARRATMAEDDYGPNTSPDLIEQLLEAGRLLRAGTTSLSFGAGQTGEIASHCTLFCEEDLNGRRVAIVDHVATLRAHRRQGLSKAAVSAAIRAAGEWGADLVAIPADADDWPQIFYAGLGFAPTGRQVELTRRLG